MTKKQEPTKLIPLTNNKFALVEAKDFDFLSKYKWYTRDNKRGHLYAMRTKKPNVCMHRIIMKAKPSQIVDHINRNGLDNRRSNLRFCTASENLYNQRARVGTSKYKGVFYCKRDRLWIMTIKKDKKRWRGSFKSETEAYEAYCKKAIELHGEFVRLK